MANDFTKKEGATIVKQVELKTMVIKLRSDGIMQFDFKPCDEYTIHDLKETNMAADILGEGEIFPRLIFIKHFIRFDKDIRMYGATEESNTTTAAAAFVVNLIALKFVGNFYISFNKPVRPTRLFDSEKAAVEWLKTFMIKN